MAMLAMATGRFREADTAVDCAVTTMTTNARNLTDFTLHHAGCLNAGGRRSTRGRTGNAAKWGATSDRCMNFILNIFVLDYPRHDIILPQPPELPRYQCCYRPKHDVIV